MPRRELEWKSKHSWAPITVKENMSVDVVAVTVDALVMDIAVLMRDRVVGCVPVSENGKLIGMITDRDITCRVTAEGLDPATTTAQAIMTSDVSCCTEDDLLIDAANVMAQKRIRRLPVLNREGELVGLLTADDLAWQTDRHLVGDVVGRVYAPHE